MTRAFTLIEMLVGLALSLLILTVLATVLAGSLTFTRRIEGRLAAAGAARGVFQMIERDLMGAFGYSEPDVSGMMISGSGPVPTKGLIDPARPCFFGAYPGAEPAPPAARWVTASPNGGSADYLRVAYRAQSPAGVQDSKRHVLYREVLFWLPDGSLPSPQEDIIARRVKGIAFEAKTTPTNLIGGINPEYVPKTVKVTIEVFAGTEADMDAPVMNFVRTFIIPAGVWE